MRHPDRQLYDQTPPTDDGDLAFFAALTQEVTDEIEVSFESETPETSALWCTFQYPRAACLTPTLLEAMILLQRRLQERFRWRASSGQLPFRFLIWRSKSVAWSLGGDLREFAECVKHKEGRLLRDYADDAIEMLYTNYTALDLPIATVGLIEGDAIAGGLEGLLLLDYVVIEEHVRVGLSEIAFNTYPGMGATSVLVREIGERAAMNLILDGAITTAHELDRRTSGKLFNMVVERGAGERSLRAFMAQLSFGAFLGLRRAMRTARGLTQEELMATANDWATHMMTLDQESQRKLARRIVVQERSVRPRAA